VTPRRNPAMDLFDQAAARGRQDPPKALSVTQLLRRMKGLLEDGIGSQWVEGEVSNLRAQPSGHWYFTLKDEGAQIQCAMFGARKKPGSAALTDGAKVRVWAEAGVYEARGQLQLIVLQAEASGTGDLMARFEALKARLLAEGLFDPARKKSLPPFPTTIGLVTSASGAALQDILQVLGRRAPWVRTLLYPVRVQGKGAEREIAQAIRHLGEPEAHGIPRCDLIIVGRGGGSLEDLWCFNEEIVARAIATCPIPILSAVGHEIDFTIADFAADLRAPTPSAAAEMAVPDGNELRARLQVLRRRLHRATAEPLDQARQALQRHRRSILQRDADRLLREWTLRIDGRQDRLDRATHGCLDLLQQHLETLRSRLARHRPADLLARRSTDLETLRSRLHRRAAARIEEHCDSLHHLADLLRALGPDSALRRGFSITTGPDGSLLRSATNLAPGTLLHTRLADGTITSQVIP
jgi:exodeoxyribonuclease VII large subunit